jgi:hypothetical protein
MPLRADTEAESPVAPPGTGLAAAMVGVAGGATTETEAFPGALLAVPFDSTQLRAIDPTDPAV